MKTKMKRLCVDVLIDLASGFCLTAAIYSFAVPAGFPIDRHFRNRHDPVPASGNAHRHDERSAEYSDRAVLLQNSWETIFI